MIPQGILVDLRWQTRKALEAQAKLIEACKMALSKMPTIPSAGDSAKSDQNEKKKL